jgi:hypothetical protein
MVSGCSCSSSSFFPSLLFHPLSKHPISNPNSHSTTYLPPHSGQKKPPLAKVQARHGILEQPPPIRLDLRWSSRLPF